MDYTRGTHATGWTYNSASRLRRRVAIWYSQLTSRVRVSCRHAAVVGVQRHLVVRHLVHGLDDVNLASLCGWTSETVNSRRTRLPT